MRILTDTLFGLVYAHKFKHFNRTRFRLLFIFIRVEQNRLHQLVSYRKYRV